MYLTYKILHISSGRNSRLPSIPDNYHKSPTTQICTKPAAFLEQSVPKVFL